MLNATRRGEIVFVYLNRDRTLRFEFILVDVIREIPGTLILKFECRFRSSGTSRTRITSCNIDLSFSTPESPTPFIIATQPTIEAPPAQEIEVTHTSSSGIMGQVAISYIASLRARFSCTSMKRYSVTEKEMREGGIRGLHGIDLQFYENRELRRGLNGEMGVAVRMDGTECVTCIRCKLSARLNYTIVHTFGFATSHVKKVDTVFMLVL